MQPVREILGNRLLGSSEAKDKAKGAAKDRLVRFVADQLDKGATSKRMRKELEAFRRRQLDRLQREYEQRQHTSASEGGGGGWGREEGTGHSSSSRPRGAAFAVPVGESPSGALAPGVDEASGAATSGTPPAANTTPEEVLEWLSVDEVMRLAEERRRDILSASAAAAAGKTGRVARPSVRDLKDKGDLKKGSSIPQADIKGAIPLSLQPDDSGPAADEQSSSGEGISCVEATSIKGLCTKGLGTVPDAVAKGEATENLLQPLVSLAVTDASSSSIPAVRSQVGALSSSPGDAFIRAEGVLDGDCPHSASSSSGAGSGPGFESGGCLGSAALGSKGSRAASTGNAGSPSVPPHAACSGALGVRRSGLDDVEDLMTLPSSSLRPVRFSDFERALTLIMPTDFEGLEARYEEWNARYGSGADAKRGANGRGRGQYSTMYA